MTQFGYLDLLFVALASVFLFYSYSKLVKKNTKTRYTDHPLWLGMPRGLVLFLSGLQILAALGFLSAFVSWIIDPPLEPETWRLRLTFVNLVLTAGIWPLAVINNYPAITMGSLLLTAWASVQLLVWAIMEQNPRWWVIAGVSCLCLVTVFADGIVWNAMYAQKQMYDANFIQSLTNFYASHAKSP